MTCKRLEGHSYGSVPLPDLPAERVSEDPPFSHTGVDFAGLLYINVVNKGQSDERQEKVYLLIYLHCNPCSTFRVDQKHWSRHLSIGPTSIC